MTTEIHVAIPSPQHQTFTYTNSGPIKPGTRVLVSFGAQQNTVGVVLEERLGGDLKAGSFELKKVREVLDQEPIYSPVLLRLAHWMSSYYMHPIGEVLRTMLPASRTKKTKISFQINPSAEIKPTSKILDPREFFGKKIQLTQISLKKKLKLQIQDDALLTKTMRAWTRRGWIVQSSVKEIQARTSLDTTPLTESPQERATGIAQNLFRLLNHHQEKAVETIYEQGLLEENLSHLKPFLLFGITGSGKTEVFLHLIRKIVLAQKNQEATGQTLVLVPEISLTPQMTNIFESRFPGCVAVVHSAMEDHERWETLDRVRRGDALILIGPRSAVFGPFKNLRLIIVDEEHDGSYKQGDRLPYHGRDIAVLRASFEKIPIILASATPSMESWYNAKNDKYHLVELPERASARELPAVQMIPVIPSSKRLSALTTSENSDEENFLFSEELLEALRSNLNQKQQSIILVNRRGYAHFLLNMDDRTTAQCPNCSISLTVHNRRQLLRCHYCDYSTSVNLFISSQSTSHWAVAGYGSQKAEDILAHLIPSARIARLDSDTVKDPKYLPAVLEKFRRGDIDILVGTQILAKGHDFPNVTLIGILEIDQILALPDFRGGERTFQLLVQAAGRSGRGHLPGKVLVQSARVNHPIVTLALSQDYRAFADLELEFRKAMNYPPYGRLILFEFNSTNRLRLDSWSKTLDHWIHANFSSHQEIMKNVRILGPAIAPLEVVNGRFRMNLMVLSSSLKLSRQVAGHIHNFCKSAPSEIRCKIDVDAQSTL